MLSAPSKLEAALVLLRSQFAAAKGEQDLLELLLLAEITRLPLMRQEHCV